MLSALARTAFRAREQKTLDHIVWPGLVFALVVLLPMPRSARDPWPRTAAALTRAATPRPGPPASTS